MRVKFNSIQSFQFKIIMLSENFIMNCINMEKVLSQHHIRASADEIKKLMPSDLTYEKYYGLFAAPIIPIEPITKPVLTEEVKTKITEIETSTPTKLIEDIQETSFSDPKSPPPSENISEPLSATQPKQDDQWVTIKTRSKKKPQESSQSKFESLAEQQLSSNKNKKKSLKKRLKEIQDLCKKQAAGEKLDPNQLQKIQNKKSLEKDLSALS